ncbi:hypothetical protein B0T26DRAFT_443632 [Lasiosphaeria miniovina]|uniref:Protein kinase domain-containing protein n=1 Tax=Lasiosphaeria miniovina TaxID=1954250 RepID=A0AA39ZYR5_9PEZI|nr:uncharacterized protein B0T26DRAFT_443632 [Lasiosphaeria miniovina]KAK0706126.1 hypothetical protein B0T26DRAFT_443632 [Lasiosphaeria miniovina]
MDLTSTVFVDILSPLAAFSATRPRNPESEAPAEPHGHGPGCQSRHAGDPGPGPSWATSFVNPRNRIDSLTQPLSRPKWRLDGADVDGRRFFAVPTFAIDAPPLRIDVYVPPFEDYPPGLRDILKPEAAIYARRKNKRDGVMGLPIAQHLLRALEAWSSSTPAAAGDFEAQYWSAPFGSQIVVASMAAQLRDVNMLLCPDYGVEQAMLSVDALQAMWQLPSGAWPPVVDWAQLRFRRQLHEAITLVRVAQQPWRRDGADSGDFERDDAPDMVFKSLTRDQRYMYNELRMLLTLRPHAHVIPRPAYVVTKKGRFGGRRGVCGFVLQYYPLASLKERLLRHADEEEHLPDVTAAAAAASAGENGRNMIPLAQRFRWARQVAEALVHINAHSAGFYPDLKPDNVVLVQPSQSGEEPMTTMTDAVLLDLEQRGGWFSWSPPEVAYVEYLELLAAMPEAADEAELADTLTTQLGEYMPGWAPGRQHDRYRNTAGGFSAPWLALLRDSSTDNTNKSSSSMLAKAQVFMLGKLLWCIFEVRPRVRCGIDHELLQDNDPPPLESGAAFPAFTRATPVDIRALIHACTLGAPEWEPGAAARRLAGVVLRGGRLVPAAAAHRSLRDVTDGDTRLAVATWWAAEVRRAREFMAELLAARRAHGKGQRQDDESGLLALVRRRPALEDVLAELERVERELT